MHSPVCRKFGEKRKTELQRDTTGKGQLPVVDTEPSQLGRAVETLIALKQHVVQLRGAEEVMVPDRTRTVESIEVVFEYSSGQTKVVILLGSRDGRQDVKRSHVR